MLERRKVTINEVGGNLDAKGIALQWDRLVRLGLIVILLVC